MTVNRALELLLGELAGDVPAPLCQSFTLASLWNDLARLAGEPVPPPVRLLIDGPPPGQLALPAPPPPAA